MYNVLTEQLDQGDGLDEKEWSSHLTDAGIEIAEMIDALRIVDWRENRDVEKQMRNEVEDFLLRLRKEHGLTLDFDTIDRVLDDVIRIARSRR